jgi:hypothetical protein
MLFINKPGPGTALSVAVDAGLPFIPDLLDVFNGVKQDTVHEVDSEASGEV